MALFDQKREQINDLTARIERAELAEGRAKFALAVPEPEFDQVKRRRWGSLRHWQDREDDRGNKVRGEYDAYGFAKFICATVFEDEHSKAWCLDKGFLTRAQIEATNAAGGALVPDAWQNSIITLVEKFGVIPANCQNIVMKSDSVMIPRRTGGVNVSFVSDGVAPTEGTATWDTVQLVAKKIACLVRLSTELAEDAMVNVADWLAGELAYALSSKIDDAGFTGDGTQSSGGIVGLSNAFVSNTKGVFTATGHTTLDTISLSDCNMAKGLIPAYALPNAKWFVSRSFYELVMMRLAANAGGNTVQTLSGDLQFKFLGLPVVIAQKLPSQTASVTGTIIAYVGDMQKACAYGAKRDVTIKRSNERYFDTDQIGLFASARFDFVAHDVGTSSVTGPLCALKAG